MCVCVWCVQGEVFYACMYKCLLFEGGFMAREVEGVEEVWKESLARKE